MTESQAAQGSAWGRWDASGWPADERTARAAWSRLAEPCDAAACALVATYGAGGALDRVRREGGGTRYAGRLAALDVPADVQRARQVGARFLIPGDREWPAGLDDLATPPLGLWVRGPLDLGGCTARSVAVVGARASSAYGEAVAAELAAGIAERGWTVVSGAAFGIDAAAHRGALAVGGYTVAFLAGGVDRPYPAAHSGLLADIAASGCVVSEVPPGAAPMRQRFLQRNRLIAAISRGTVVVEAGLRSGSRNTASTAADLGRVVMAVPGPVTAMSSAGCHDLIRAGAVLVTETAEVVEAVGEYGVDLAPVRRGETRPEDDLDPVDARVLEALPLRAGRAAADVARVAGVPESQARSCLGRLALAGLASQDPWGWRRTG